MDAPTGNTAADSPATTPTRRELATLERAAATAGQWASLDAEAGSGWLTDRFGEFLAGLRSEIDQEASALFALAGRPAAAPAGTAPVPIVTEAVVVTPDPVAPDVGAPDVGPPEIVAFAAPGVLRRPDVDAPSDSAWLPIDAGPDPGEPATDRAQEALPPLVPGDEPHALEEAFWKNDAPKWWRRGPKVKAANLLEGGAVLATAAALLLRFG